MIDIGLCLTNDEELLFGDSKAEMIKVGSEIIMDQLDIGGRRARDLAAKVFTVMYREMLSQPSERRQTKERLTMALKSLVQHNAERLALLNELNRPSPNGIACPECGAELIDSVPGITLTTNPPQVYVACPKCNYRGTRFS